MSWSTELWPGEITVLPGRQRRELFDIEQLAASIKARGQLQPIVINRNNELVAGERRYRAVSLLEDRPLRCVYTDELDPAELKAIELEENIKRSDLTWQDKCLAVLEYHELKSVEPSWNQDKLAEALCVSKNTVVPYLQVAKELRNGNQMVKDAARLSTAAGIVKRKLERAAESETSQLLAIASAKPIAAAPSSQPEAADKKPEISGKDSLSIIADLEASKASGFIINEDFTYWAETYNGPKFNLIHCDFPYGVGMDKSDQGSGDAHGSYEDDPETYWSLVDTLLNNLDNFTTDSAHLIFWFSMDYYQATYERLSTKFRVSPFPLIWHKSDNSGILPDHNRGPRRTYETAFFGVRGDRKIVRAVSNSVAAPTTKGRHMSEKTQSMLEHFFRMLVDEHSAVLDPTCGSGSAIRAAAALGAGRYLGLEQNTEFADMADAALMEQLEKANGSQA